MTTRRTATGLEAEAALGEALAHARREGNLPCRIVDELAAERIVARRQRTRSGPQGFAKRFGLEERERRIIAEHGESLAEELTALVAGQATP